jgi:hypothetical protein
MLLLVPKRDRPRTAGSGLEAVGGCAGIDEGKEHATQNIKGSAKGGLQARR